MRVSIISIVEGFLSDVIDPGSQMSEESTDKFLSSMVFDYLTELVDLDAPLLLSSECDASSKCASGADHHHVSHIERRGWAILHRSEASEEDNSNYPASFWSHRSTALLDLVNVAMRKNVDTYHPIFVYLLPATWELVLSLFHELEALLGDEVVLEPSFFAWLLRHNKVSTSELKSYVGSNFALPHRDYS